MKCPFCGADNTKVIDSRPADDNNAIKRRRQCEKCDKRFTTYEKVESETIPLFIVKKDNTREPYDRKKLELGIVRSCHKTTVPYEKIKETVDTIENELFNMEKKEISSAQVGELVMERLKDLDQVAYVRFASIYREFKDVNTFMAELTKLLK